MSEAEVSYLDLRAQVSGPPMLIGLHVGCTTGGGRGSGARRRYTPFPNVKMLKKLTQAPVPVLPPSVRALRVTMAMRNTHFGAQYVLLESETAL